MPGLKKGCKATVLAVRKWEKDGKNDNVQMQLEIYALTKNKNEALRNLKYTSFKGFVNVKGKDACQMALETPVGTVIEITSDVEVHGKIKKVGGQFVKDYYFTISDFVDYHKVKKDKELEENPFSFSSLDAIDDELPFK